jgi:5-methylcytosine-specific restriction endonuclease McrA
MSSKNKIQFTAEEIALAISNSTTMGGASKVLEVDWRTFKLEAERHGLYKPSGQTNKRFELSDILDGKHPQYPTSKLLLRLIVEGYKIYQCESCGITEWNGQKISLEVDHIDGNSGNHRLNNLQVLCPNCHSQTETYRSKKLKLK